MNITLRRFDRWVESGPFTAVDLGVYRIVYASLMLLTLPGFRWVDAFPDSLWDAPIGPFQLIRGLPPDGVMLAVEIALAISLVALALGYRTVVASAAVALLLLYGFGVSYSLGKIDHSIFVVLVPAVLVFARWGDAVSVDALLARARGRHDASDDATPQWPLRLLAVLIGLGFLTAAIPKIQAGWLDPRSQAVRNIIAQRYDPQGGGAWLAPLSVHLDVAVLWELADVSAVVIECAFILAVVSWRAFRIVLSCATLFHVGVLLTLDIAFANNVIVYGAFVSWSVLRWRGSHGHGGSGARGSRRAQRDLVPRWVRPVAPAAAVVGGLGLWAVEQQVSSRPVSWSVLLVGAAVGAGYLLRQALLGGRRRPRQIDLTGRGPDVRAGDALVRDQRG